MMHRILACFMLSVGILLVPAANCSAQSGQVDSLTSIHDGAWALSFGIGANFTLTSFDGTTVSWKRFISDNSAIRVGISTSARDMDLDDDQTRDVNEVEQVTETTHTNTYWDVTLQGYYLRYPVSSSRTRFFWGIGPVVSITNTESSYLVVVDQDSTTYERNEENKQRDLGLSAILGAEWFATRNISLHAEYGQTLLYSRIETARDEEYLNTKSTSTQEDIRWSPAQVRFGLSVYF